MKNNATISILTIVLMTVMIIFSIHSIMVGTATWVDGLILAWGTSSLVNSIFSILEIESNS